MGTRADHSIQELPPLTPTGIQGLDEILHGGLPRDEMHLVQGVTGTGKTTIALKFLGEGARAGEPTLYITLAQSQAHLERIARSHGWSVDGITIHELRPETITSRIMCGSQEGFMSIGTQQGVDVSYLSDTIVALRFFELDGELRRAVAVVKKKHSAHVPTIREIALAGGRVEISEHELRQIHHLMVPEPVIRQRTGDGATS